MASPDPVIRAVRYTMAQAAIGSLRSVALARYDGELGSHIIHIVLGMGLFIGQHEQRPFTAGKLADYLYLPRSTVTRRLQEMIEGGVVEKRGRYYYVVDAWLSRPEAIGMIREMVQIMWSACHRLSRLDIEALDTTKTHVYPQTSNLQAKTG